MSHRREYGAKCRLEERVEGALLILRLKASHIKIDTDNAHSRVSPIEDPLTPDKLQTLQSALLYSAIT